MISDQIWAKLMWAGLNLTAEDLPSHRRARSEPWFTLELVRAVAMLWLFAGLRSDEIYRLRVGAIRWQTDPASAEQPNDFVFAFRGTRIGEKYLNRVLIPMLSRKPASRARTSAARSRGTAPRATIASQLHNAKDPMTLFELQAWLGHSSPHSNQHYARITPLTLTKAYTDAGYFARNVRTIEVLLARDAITNGQAGNGVPFEFYDLGHGYCSYSFFEQCPHRMACARCDFYLPKESSQAQLLEAKDGLQRMLVEIPLTDDERAAVEGDQNAVDRLLSERYPDAGWQHAPPDRRTRAAR